MGICNRRTGSCMCYDGYDGDACQRQSCNCNNRGTCINIGLMYKTFSPKYNVTSINSTYVNWDADRTTSCICDWGFSGAACEQKLCPKGVDPLTFYSDYRAITIKTSATVGKMQGSFKFLFNGEFFYFPGAARRWTSEQCKASFESLPNVGMVKCSRSQRWTSQNGATWAVQFRQFPVMPSENNIYSNNGYPDISTFHCDTGLVTNAGGIKCEISDIVATDTPCT